MPGADRRAATPGKRDTSRPKLRPAAALWPRRKFPSGQTKHADCVPGRAACYYFAGNLWPLAAKALPKAVFGPPPAGFTWHFAHGSPVAAAYAGVACA